MITAAIVLSCPILSAFRFPPCFQAFHGKSGERAARFEKTRKKKNNGDEFESRTGSQGWYAMDSSFRSLVSSIFRQSNVSPTRNTGEIDTGDVIRSDSNVFAEKNSITRIDPLLLFYTPLDTTLSRRPMARRELSLDRGKSADSKTMRIKLHGEVKLCWFLKLLIT